ncbi:hypothetical protein ACHAWU_005989 [Discostella pseudostelligera]|uniref:Uncharacterized protein n=1 Tax=Discostella pseudostelligera TaxID=259834 RepID=A0ABD3MCU2_9STRA
MRRNAATITAAAMAMILTMHVEAFSVGYPPARTMADARLTATRTSDGIDIATTTTTHQQPSWLRWRNNLSTLTMTSISEESESSTNSSSDRKTVKRRKTGVSGDKLRESTGIRPSIHPTVINCISEALLLRSRNILGFNANNSNVAIDIGDSSTKPLDVAITAGEIASSAIQKRNDAAKSGYEGFSYDDDLDDNDDDDDYSNDDNNPTDEHNNEITTTSTDESFNIQESQLICGRVVGVVMRLRDLEATLIERVMAASWVRKYREEGSFGVLQEECDDEQKEKASLDKLLAEKIVHDPLIRMNRAECLLALFLNTVERPTMEKLSSSGEEVPPAGASTVDFIDADRLEVLMNDV